jgi:hypothetical protein
VVPVGVEESKDNEPIPMELEDDPHKRRRVEVEDMLPMITPPPHKRARVDTTPSSCETSVADAAEFVDNNDGVLADDEDRALIEALARKHGEHEKVTPTEIVWKPAKRGPGKWIVKCEKTRRCRVHGLDHNTLSSYELHIHPRGEVSYFCNSRECRKAYSIRDHDLHEQVQEFLCKRAPQINSEGEGEGLDDEDDDSNKKNVEAGLPGGHHGKYTKLMEAMQRFVEKLEQEFSPNSTKLQDTLIVKRCKEFMRLLPNVDAPRRRQWYFNDFLIPVVRKHFRRHIQSVQTNITEYVTAAYHEVYTDRFVVLKERTESEVVKTYKALTGQKTNDIVMCTKANGVEYFCIDKMLQGAQGQTVLDRPLFFDEDRHVYSGYCYIPTGLDMPRSKESIEKNLLPAFKPYRMQYENWRGSRHEQDREDHLPLRRRRSPLQLHD